MITVINYPYVWLIDIKATELRDRNENDFNYLESFQHSTYFYILIFRFQEWQSKRKVKLPRTGEAELANAQQLLKSGGVPFGSRRYRHTKLTAPDPNSKSFERKDRKRQKAVKNGESVPEFPKKNKRGVRSELKSGHQIQKQRKVKEKRREKTGRHFLAKNKKKK